MKYHLVTLGCQMNKADSERVRRVIEGMGFVATEKEEEAQLLGVIACSVRQKSIDKAYSRIYKWNKRKDRNSLITFITGCVLPADKERFLKLFDMIFSMSELPQFPDMIAQYGVVTAASVRNNLAYTEKNDEPVYEPSAYSIDFSALNKEERRISAADIHPVENSYKVGIDTFWHIEPEYSSNFEAFVPIQNGCDKFCSFCAVPYTRGREVSRPSGEILEQVQSLIDRDFKSITLLGQNVNSYGLDKKGEEISFASLLEEIGKMGDRSGKEFWVYFTSPHPRDMGPEVIDVIAKYKCLAKQIHLPLQSGDEKVLMKMNRKHSLAKYRQIVEYIRHKIPEATLFTDIIVGFTGESDEQYANTQKAMAEFKYNMAYVAVYSPRPGATSSRWDDDIPMDVKKKRLHGLTEIFARSSAEWNSQLVGKTLRVLVTGTERKTAYLSGYTEGRINVRIYSHDTNLIGKIVDVNIVSNGDFSLAGDLVKQNQEKLAAV